MSIAVTHFDPVVGVDMHLVLVPAGPAPVPTLLPHPYFGIVFDAQDWLPIIGASVMVNGVPRAQAGSGGMATPPHFPMGLSFVPPLPGNESETWMGSATVAVDGDAMVYSGLTCLTCSSVGAPAPFRRKGKTKLSLFLPTSMVTAIPKGPAVLVGGAPTITLSWITGKVQSFALGKALDRLKKTGIGKRITKYVEDFQDSVEKAFDAAKKKIFRNMKPGFIKCKVLRAEPVDSVTGEVVVDQVDFDLPGRIPMPWTRHYTSGSERIGLCGRGWETLADARLEIGPEGTILFHDGTGVASFFEALPVDRPMRELVAGAVLWRTENYFTVRQAWGLTYYFPRSADRPRKNEILVSSISDQYDNTWEFSRTETGLAAIIEGAGRVLEAQSEQGFLKKLTLKHPQFPEESVLAKYEYDGDQNLVSVLDAKNNPYLFEYKNGCLIQHTDRNGLSFYYEYDAYHSKGRAVHTWGDGGLYDYSFFYDPENYWTQITDSLGGISTLEYDERLLVTREIDDLGAETTYSYDDDGRTTGVIDALGRTILYEYDEKGLLTGITRPDGSKVSTKYNELGKPIEKIDANGNTWIVNWDERGHLKSRVDPLANEWNFQGNSFGDLTSISGPEGLKSTFVHDDLGQVVGITSPTFNARSILYDIFGNISKIVKFSGEVTRFEHDIIGNLTEAHFPDGATFKWEYDKQGNIIASTDANGNKTEFVIAGIGEVSEKRHPDGTSVKYQRDTEENIISVINEVGDQFSFERNGNGDVIKTTDYEGNETKYIYDKVGYLVQKIDALGRKINYGYDSLGRIITKSNNADIQEEYEYDFSGNLIVAKNLHSHVKRKYNKIGNLIEENTDGFSISFDYDAVGRRIAKNASEGAGVSYSYKKGDGRRSIEVEDIINIYQGYDSERQVFVEEFGDQIIRETKIDSKGLLSARTVKTKSKKLSERVVTRDKLGNVIGQESTTHVGAKVRNYQYDSMGRIVRAGGTDSPVEDFSYDATGSICVRKQSAEEGKVLQDPDGSQYNFDNVGNLIRRQGERGTCELKWNALNQLVEAQNEENKKIYFTYDALGRRIKKISDESSINFYWDHSQLYGEKEKSLFRQYEHQPDSFEPLLLVENGAPYIFNSDESGAPRELFAIGGEIVTEVDYFGIAKATQKGKVAVPFRFQNQYYDAEIDLSYNFFRYFSPSCFGFVSEDPIGFRGGHNLTWYGPNPWVWVDVFGLKCYFDKKVKRWRSVDKGADGKGGKGRFVGRPDDPAEFIYNDGADYDSVIEWNTSHGSQNVWAPDADRFPDGGFRFVTQVEGREKPYRMHGHNKDPDAVRDFVEGNSANGPTVTINVGGNKVLLQDGTQGNYNATNMNRAHIPLRGTSYPERNFEFDIVTRKGRAVDVV